MEAFRAVLFDMDGVAIDTRQSIIDFWQTVAAEQGVWLIGCIMTHPSLQHVPRDRNSAFVRMASRKSGAASFQNTLSNSPH
jgi:beta-phosphoglucomutase-like phosphatase (HAD superfamily)